MTEEDKPTEPELMDEGEKLDSKGAPEDADTKKDDGKESEKLSQSEDSDDSAVVISHQDVVDQPRAIQVVSIGTSDDGE